MRFFLYIFPPFGSVFIFSQPSACRRLHDSQAWRYFPQRSVCFIAKLWINFQTVLLYCFFLDRLEEIDSKSMWMWKVERQCGFSCRATNRPSAWRNANVVNLFHFRWGGFFFFMWIVFQSTFSALFCLVCHVWWSDVLRISWSRRVFTMFFGGCFFNFQN